MESRINNDQETLRSLCSATRITPGSITPIAAGGSSRRYYRIVGNDGRTVVGTCSGNITENKAFIYLSRHLSAKGLPVPSIISVNDNCTAYLQTDAGEKTLFDVLKPAIASDRWAGLPLELLEKAVRSLPGIQFRCVEGLDQSQCLSPLKMDGRAIMRDLNYFKYCFLKPLDIHIDEELLDNEFDMIVGWSENNESTVPEGFILRDCQSRNIMISSDGEPTWIDYQGGRIGPVTYDLVSLLWQTRARIPDDLKQKLTDTYFAELQKLDANVKREDFDRSVSRMLLIRLLQVLGAYGLRGLSEGKTSFLSSIPESLRRLDLLLGTTEFQSLKEIARAVKEAKRHPWCREPEIREKLIVDICSFSYKQGMPRYRSQHGGGFIFDCRAPHNPGRYDQYKKLTGLDPEVKEFLDGYGEMSRLVDNAEAMVGAAVSRYLERGFDSLSAGFGCTGGRHRSVYGAEMLAKRLNEKYGVEVRVNHTNLGISYKLPSRE